MKNIFISATLMVSSLFLFPTFAGPCTDDVDKYCASAKGYPRKVFACLKQHEAELSPACQTKGQELKDKFKNFRTACEGEIKTYCSDSKPGPQLWSCLETNSKSLTPSCKTAIPSRKAI